MKIAITNGRVIDPAHHLDGLHDIAIENNRITHVGKLPPNFAADKIIDARDRWVIPGLIDLCCRPQLPHPYGSQCAVEAKAALTRGFTTLCIPPDGDPLTSFRVHENGLSTVIPFGSLTAGGEDAAINDLTALASAGCVAFTTGQKPIKDLSLLRHCYEYAASFNLLVIIQPNDPTLSQRGVAHEGMISTRLGLPGISETAETCAIATHLRLIEQTGVRAHFTCLSTRGAVEQLASAKANLPVTADVSMHHLYLTEQDLSAFDANCHVYPPLRSIRDRDALLAGVASGVIDAICSDHRPLHAIAKLAPFADTVPGMSTMDVFLSLGIALVKNNFLSASRLIQAIAEQPSRILGLNQGGLTPQQPANICIVDPESPWQVSDESLRSQGKNCPFNGWELPGKVTQVIHQGQCVYE